MFDVIFVAEPADPVSIRVAGEMMRFVLPQAFFQVDAGLRPEGRHGEVVRNLTCGRRLLPAMGQDLGVPGAAESPAGLGDAELGKQYIAALNADGLDRLREVLNIS